MAHFRKYGSLVFIYLSAFCMPSNAQGLSAQLHQPLAIAVIGGFIVGLPLLLIVLPSMLYKFYK